MCSKSCKPADTDYIVIDLIEWKRSYDAQTEAERIVHSILMFLFCFLDCIAFMIHHIVICLISKILKSTYGN